MIDNMNWNTIVTWLEPLVPGILQDLEFLLRIFVAMVLGLLIGNERKNRNKSAGLRTHAMVALGSALMMVVSKYGFGDTVQGDGARLAAQVVSGVLVLAMLTLGILYAIRTIKKVRGIVRAAL